MTPYYEHTGIVWPCDCEIYQTCEKCKPDVASSATPQETYPSHDFVSVNGGCSHCHVPLNSSESKCPDGRCVTAPSTHRAEPIDG